MNFKYFVGDYHLFVLENCESVIKGGFGNAELHRWLGDQ